MMIYIKDIVKKVWRTGQSRPSQYFKFQIDFFNGYGKKKIVKHSWICDS